ncbi:MAG TPA: hypothetical protein VI981_00820 [Candidatus Paceibacterota bacterium]
MLTVHFKKKNIPHHKFPLAIGLHKRHFFMLERYVEGNMEELRIRTSTNGRDFSGGKRVEIAYEDKIKEDISSCSDFRIFCADGDVVMTYIKTTRHGQHLVFAVTKNLAKWVAAGTVPHVHDAGVLVPQIKKGAGHTVFWSTDRIHTISSLDLENWSPSHVVRIPAWHFFEGSNFNIIGATVTPAHIIVLFESKISVDILTDNGLRDEKVGEHSYAKLGVAVFSRFVPTHPVHVAELPLVEIPFKKQGMHFLGVVTINRRRERLIRLYATDEKGDVVFFEFDEAAVIDEKDRKKGILKRFSKNPIIEPTEKNWEVGGTFNPTALYLDGKVHLLYRAVGQDGFSYIGYATSADGKNVDERLDYPVYTPRAHFEGGNGYTKDSPGLFYSGGSWGGCEDPKVTRIDDTIYMTYVAHSGYWPMRTALTSISVEDFLNRKWKWTPPMLMSPPNVGSKSVVILPEKVNDQFVIFHRMWPSIMIDHVPALEFGEGKRWLKGEYRIIPRRSFWDSRKLSMGSAPIKTKKGWLAIYNAVDRIDGSQYKIGAMLLRLDDPREVIARTKLPLLAPQAWYENDGKPGVVYPGGAVELDQMLHVYYGGGDKVSCVATISTEELLWHLEKDSQPKIEITPVKFQ